MLWRRNRRDTVCASWARCSPSAACSSASVPCSIFCVRPRDIEPEVARLSDVYLYTLDDLSALVQIGGEKREAAVAQAEAIIETGVQSFVQWLDRRGSIPLIQALHAQADDWRSLEIARARKLLAGGEDVGAVLEALSKGLTQKMLHGTLAELRAADGDERARLAQTVSRLFLRTGGRGSGDDKR